MAQLGVTSNTYKCILALGSNLDYDATKGEGFGLIHLYLSRLCPKISPIRRHACEGRQPPNTGPLLLYKLLLKSDVCSILSLHCSFFYRSCSICSLPFLFNSTLFLLNFLVISFIDCAPALSSLLTPSLSLIRS